MFGMAGPAKEDFKNMEIGCYYFPNYHTGDTRNSIVHGKEWSEWVPLSQAIPRFPGHFQPRTPLWGPQDEKSPEVMAQKIAAAAEAGIGVFIFDWYYYDDGPFLEKGLEQGFLGAANSERLKFCSMWANHNWYDIHPAPPTERKLLYPGKVTRATIERIAELHIQRYFTRPNYFTIDGCPYFSIYELGTLIASCGSIAETQKALQDFRTAAKQAGFPDIHLNAIIWGQPILPGESTPKDPAKLAVELGFDSVASYVWNHHFFMTQRQTPYTAVRDAYLAFWEKTIASCPVEYFPNVSVGWDTSPRTRPDAPCPGTAGYPYGQTVVGNTPEEFAKSLQIVKRRLEQLAPRHPFITINSWNEWTEGSYLEPDTRYKMAYLDALRRTFPENVH